MTETNGIPDMTPPSAMQPDVTQPGAMPPQFPMGIPPGAPGSPEAPITPPQMPSFGQPKLPDTAPMNAVGKVSMTMWIIIVAFVVLVGGFIVWNAASLFATANDFGPFDSNPSSTTCEWDHDPSDAEVEACLNQ